MFRLVKKNCFISTPKGQKKNRTNFLISFLNIDDKPINQ